MIRFMYRITASLLTACIFSYPAMAIQSTVIYPGKTWQTATRPEPLGWSTEKLAVARAYSEKIGSAAVMIIENGRVVDAWGDIARKYQLHSMRKPLMSALMGIYMAKGHIDLSKTMAELSIDDNEPSLTDIEKKATLADLIKSRSGIYHPALGEAPGMKAVRPRRHSHAPGTFYYYNNWDFNAVGTIFEQETGINIFEAFSQRIAAPLQMEDFKVDDGWYDTGPESNHRYYGFRMSTRDLARFALIYLRRGRWKDKQIISSQWIEESTAPHSAMGSYQGYGYMWRTSQNGGPYPNIHVRQRTFGHSGLGVHFFMVLPSRNLIIVHRVNTDIPGPYPRSTQLGRLLWLILDAAGETDIGENPSIDAAGGVRLSADKFLKLLEKGTFTAEYKTPPGLTEDSERSFTVSFFPDGSCSLFQKNISAKERYEDTGKWWFEEAKFCFQWKRLFAGRKDCVYLVLDQKILKIYSLDGTLNSRLKIIRE